MFQINKIISKKLFFFSTLFIVIFFLSCLLVNFSINNYPVLDGDASCFMPCAVNYASGNGLVNNMWHPKQVFNPSHPEWLTWHGFAFPMLTSALATSPSYLGARMSLLYMQLIILFSMVFIMIKLTHGRYNFKVWILIIAAIFTSESYCSATGRPELLVSMWISLGMLLAILFREYKWIIIGIVLGLTTITSPVPAIYLGLFTMIYLSKVENMKDVLTIFLQMGSAFLISIFVGFLFYPFSFSAWVLGVAGHSGVAFGYSRFEISSFIYFWMLSPNSKFFGLLFLAACILFYFYWNNFSRKLKYISAVQILLFTVVFGKSVGIEPEKIYYVTALSPLLILFIFKQSITVNKVKINYKLLFTTSIFLICSLGFIRTILVFPAFKNHGLNYSEGLRQFDNFLEKTKKQKNKIGVSCGLYALVPLDANIKIIGDESNIAENYDYDYIVIQQANRATSKPSLIPNYQLISDNFSSFTLQILGKSIANTYGGYNFAVYKRIK